jgi:hypothetical protein
MLYIAFFSLAERVDETDSELNHVPACAVTEARDLPEALAKFRKLVTAYRADTNDLDWVAKVYLQEVSALDTLPPDGIVARWGEYSPDDGQWIIGWMTYPPKTDYERYRYPDHKLPLLERLAPAFVVFDRGPARRVH